MVTNNEAIESKREKWCAMYEVAFGARKGKWQYYDSQYHASQWDALIDKIPLTQLHDYFKALTGIKSKRIGGPSLSACWHAWKLLQKPQDAPDAASCAMCNSSGWLRLPAAWIGGVDQYDFVRNTDFLFHMWAFPCQCSIGRRRATQCDLTEDTQKRAFEMEREYRRMAGCVGEEAEITWREFIEGHKTNEVRSCERIKANVVKESILQNLKRIGEKVVDFEPKGSYNSTTLAGRRARTDDMVDMVLSNLCVAKPFTVEERAVPPRQSGLPQGWTEEDWIMEQEERKAIMEVEAEEAEKYQ